MKLLSRLSLAFLALAAGCDSFSVIDQYSAALTGPSSTLTLDLQTSTLQQNETTVLVASGGVSPYSFSVLAGSLSYAGTLGTAAANPDEYTAGTAIGTVKIRVIDAAGDHVDAIATILPPTPANFSVAYTTSPKKATLGWTYPDTAYITGYLLLYSTDSVTFSTLATLPKTATSYVQNGADSNYYKLNAVSGSYQSVPAETH